jgi:hypothetical protein
VKPKKTNKNTTCEKQESNKNLLQEQNQKNKKQNKVVIRKNTQN